MVLKERTTTAVEEVKKEETEIMTASVRLDELIAVTNAVEKKGLSKKIRNYFSTVMELKDIYFGSPMRLDFLDIEYRANLSFKDKAYIDAPLHSIWTN